MLDITFPVVVLAGSLLFFLGIWLGTWSFNEVVRQRDYFRQTTEYWQMLYRSVCEQPQEDEFYLSARQPWEDEE